MRGLLAGLAACAAAAVCVIGAAGAGSASSSPTPFALPATFSGLEPCADCPGIRATLALSAGGAYVLTLHYLERDVPDVVYTGPWSYDKGTSRVKLSSKFGAPQYFLVVDARTLRVLDRSGNAISTRAPQTLTLVSLGSNPWTLVELRGQRIAAGATVQPISLSFEPGGRISGSTGCNQLTGSFTQHGSELHFSPLATTRMMCATGADVEAAFVKALGEVQTYNLDNGRLTLYGGGWPLLRFKPAPLKPVTSTEH
jgi:copper homeostasis protein (lipoprotein)